MDKLTDNKFLFSFEGRINRFKYWYALFASGIFCLVLLLLVAFVIGGILGADVRSIHIQGHVLDVFRILRLSRSAQASGTPAPHRMRR